MDPGCPGEGAGLEITGEGRPPGREAALSVYLTTATVRDTEVPSEVASLTR